MAKLRAQSFFGELSTRLQLWLGLDTEVSPEFSPNCVPVLVVGNTDDPGYADRRGVRWAVGGVAAGGGVGAYLGIEAFGQEIVIDGVEFWTNTASQFTLKWNTATEASPSGATFPSFVPALDRATNRVIPAPVRFLAQGGAAPAVVGDRTLYQGIATAGFPATWRHSFHMMPGSRLWMEQSVVAATVYCNFWGRSF